MAAAAHFRNTGRTSAGRWIADDSVTGASVTIFTKGKISTKCALAGSNNKKFQPQWHYEYEYEK